MFLTSFLKMKDSERLVSLSKILFLLILITVGFNILFLMRYNFQADSAFFFFFSQEQLRTHSLFPEGMYYSSGLFVLTPNLFIIPFLLLTDNLVLARQLAILLLWIFVYLVLYKVFVTKTEKNTNGFVLASSFLSILYVNSNVVSMHFYQGAYISYLLFLLVFLALMNNIISSNCFEQKSLSGILILYIITNLGDIRNLIVWGIPGFIAYVLFVFIEAERSLTLFKRKISEQKLIRNLFNGILLAFIVFVLMARFYGNAGSTTSILELAAKDYGESLNHIFVGLFNLFGNSYSAEVFSGAGIFKFINFFITIIINFIVPIVAIKNFHNIKLRSSKFLILFSLTSSLMYLLILFLTGVAIYLDRYIIPVYNNNIILFAVIGSFLTEQIKKYKIATISVFCVLFYVLSCNLFFLYSQKDSLLYHKNGFFASTVEGVVDFLESKGLEYGYATFINAEQYSVISNNKVRIRSVGFSQGSIFPFKWLTSDSFYMPDCYHGNTFLMLTEKELEQNFPKGTEILGPPKDVFKFKQFNIFVYDYNISNRFSKGRKGIWLMRGAKSAIYVVDE